MSDQTNDNVPKLTVERSNQLAFCIRNIQPFIQLMDVEYMREVVRGMFRDANRQDTLAVLNPSYNPAQTNLMRTQAQALSKLVEYIDLLVEADRIKKEIGAMEEHWDEMKRLFF